MSADELLTCGSLTVRSRQASERSTVAASNRVILNKAVYRTNGIPSPELKLNGNLIKLSPVEDFQHAFTTESNCPAVFFDQTSYMFSIQFPKETVSAWVFSPLAKWYINSDWDAESNKLLIPINFGNDLGDFELCWEWKSKDGEINTSSFSGQVFSTKLDIYDHFRIMLDEVQERFDWIRLDILKQTSWGWAYDAGSSKNYKTWLLIFQEVRLSMEEKLQKLIFQHRKRLISESRKLKAERINKINPKFEEKIGEGILQQPNRLYSVQRKVLDSDTPENRYIKHILSQTIEQLNDVLKKIESNDEISDIFKTRLGDWAGEWGNLQQHRFWRGIGNFHGLRHESKILSQDPLYAGIRRSWYLLQNGLKFLNNDLHGGIQNAAQLYEIWCLIKVDQIIREVGWISVEDQPIFFNNEENSFDNKGNILPSGSVKFNFTKPSSSDVKLSLLFQPTAGCTPAKNGLWDGITAVPVTQRPDIVLRLHRDDLPQKPIYTWIFDAKYRLNGNDAPDDAINQMHQYRDAILWAGDTAGVGHLIRESVGAFALYPGIEDEINIESKQIVSIQKTNIGAFPLRPNPEMKIPILLKDRISKFIDVSKDYGRVREKQAEYFKSVPIVKSITKNIFAKCITKPKDGMNTKEYWNDCRLYRLPDKIVQTEMLDLKNWTYIIPASRKKQFGNFPILTVKKLTRKDVKAAYFEKGIPMYERKERESEDYWLFTLGKPLENMPNLADIEKNRIVQVSEFDF